MRYAIPRANATVDPEYLRLLERLQQSAIRLDARYRIPLIQVHIGWDAIIGLVPIAGDIISLLLSTDVLRQARSLGADGRLMRRMAANVVVDALLGAIPIVGSVFDVFYRANMRNMRLLLDEIERQRQGRGHLE